MKLFLLLSHSLTEHQVKQAREDLGITTINHLPSELAELWSSVPPELESLKQYLQPIFEWLKDAEPGDYVLVQGDFGATYMVVDYCFSRGLIPVYATTKRLHREEQTEEGVKMIKVFRHVRFRRYEKWNGF